MAILALALPGFVSMLLIVTALKWFDAQGSVSDYEGGRDLDSLVNLCVHLVVSLFDIPHTWFFPASRRSQASSQTSNPLPLPRRSSLTPTRSTKSFSYAFIIISRILLLNALSYRTRITIQLSRSPPLGAATARK